MESPLLVHGGLRVRWPSAACQERTLLRVPRVNEMELDQYAKLKIEVRNQKALN